jgi:uncharacterized membrane protein
MEDTAMAASPSVLSLDRLEQFPTYSEVQTFSAGSLALLLIAYGLSRRTVSGLALAITGVPLAYRCITGRWPPSLPVERLREIGNGTARALGAGRGIQVSESVRLEKPLAEAYRFWRQLENLPRFMDHLVKVSDLGNGRSHWVAKGPAGVKVEWDAEIINDVANQVIGWRSLPGGDITTAGSVNFDELPNGLGTQLTVRLQYEPPAGRMGDFVAQKFCHAPSQTIREDLRRFKQLIDSGKA